MSSLSFDRPEPMADTASTSTQSSTMSPPQSQPEPVSTPARPVSKAVSVLSKNPTNECFQGVVTIEVGPEKKAFIIHKDLLCFYSDYFRAAFNGSFKEATDGKLSLPNERAELFDIVNYFIYTKELRSNGGVSGSSLDYGILAPLWFLGDRLLIPALQNLVIDTLVQRFRALNQNFSPDAVARIYHNTLVGSPLRKLAIDLQMHSHHNKEKLSKWPHEGLVDLAIAMGDLKGPQQSFNNQEKCRYHVHAEGEHC